MELKSNKYRSPHCNLSGLHSEISKLVLKQFEIHSRKATTLCAINIQLYRQEYQWYPTNRSIVILP